MEYLDFSEIEQPLKDASDNVDVIIEKYNTYLSTLSIETQAILYINNLLNKINTIREMNPKGGLSQEDRNERINYLEQEINKIISIVFPQINDINHIKDIVIEKMNSELNSLLFNIKEEIKKAYKQSNEELYTVLPIHGLSTLNASMNRENQYLNSINNGVFATSTLESIKRYIARANVRGMHANGDNIIYPSNPFLSIEDENLKLIKPVSVYSSNVDDYEPQIDLRIIEGIPRFIFDGEWIAHKEMISVKENLVECLPTTFIEDNNVSYIDENGDKVNININNRKL